MRPLRQTWDRVSIYLPVLLMGMLALGTYWLIHTTPALRADQPMLALRHEPDYFMRGFALTAYDAQGRVKSEIRGDEFRHYPDTDTIEIDRPQIRSFSLSGYRATATAKLALANGDGSEVQLIGDAVMVREAAPGAANPTSPRMEFRSEFLHAFMDTERVRSHRPVTLTRGNDRLSADAFEFSNLDRVLDLRGHVVGDVSPKAVK
jgi:lipopolysaccharide export system protein LptC